MTMTTMTSRWRVRAQMDGDSIRLVMNEYDKTVAVMTLSSRLYHAAAKDLIVLLTMTAQLAISETLAKRLWSDAQSQTMSALDGDAAKEKLLDFGWTKEKIDKYATELALALSQQLVELLPGGHP